MKSLGVINQNDFEPQDYFDRKTVRAVILNEDNSKVLFFGNHFVGGGVEENETDEEALHREAMEEAGATIEIIRPIGKVIAYRDAIKKKYVVHGYLCKQVGPLVKPTTTQPDEINATIRWLGLQEAIDLYIETIEKILKEHGLPLTDDIAQSRSHNCSASLMILQEAVKSLQ